MVKTARNKWSHSYQWGAIPRYPSQTATKMAAYVGIGAEVVKLHTVVVRERPHELVHRQTKASLVENDEAHHVAVTWPRLRLAPRRDPLRPIGVGNRAEKTSIDKRLQHLHRRVGATPRIRLEDSDARHRCSGEHNCNGKTNPRLLAPSFSLFPSPHFFPALSSALSKRSKAERAIASEKGMERQSRGSSRIYRGEGERRTTKSETGERRNRGDDFLDLARLMQIR